VKLKFALIILFIASNAVWLFGQNRYLDEIFTNVNITANVTYSINATVQLLPQIGQAVPQSITLDVYQPAGDLETNRPLVLVFHDGNFLSFPQNGIVNGTNRDSTIIEICRQLARRGFVAAAVNYRLGWNPVSSITEERLFTMINATYRGMQDARTCIRFFKKSVVDNNNVYGIDPEKITLWGVGSGGYISSFTSSLDSFQKILSSKFITTLPDFNQVHMVSEDVNGNIYGTSLGVVPPGYPVFPVGDTLCYPNHVFFDNGTTISSDYAFTVNMGGAIVDSSWIDSGQNPWISFHVPTDLNAPFIEGYLISGWPIGSGTFEIQGSYLIQKLSTLYGNNNVFHNLSFIDPFTAVANTRNDGFKGLFPLINPDQSSPWNFWADNNPNAPGPADKANALAVIDTVMHFFAPRACIVLGLDCNLEYYVNVNEVNLPEVKLNIYPNPATSKVHFISETGSQIQSIELFNLSGQLLRQFINIGHSAFHMNRHDLSSGMYIVRLKFKEGTAIKKVVFE
jgi:hypothetical protein